MTTSTKRIASVLAAISVSALAAVLFLRHIDLPAMSASELELAHEARSVAANNGTDSDGRSYPVFWHGSGDRWFAPMPLYASAVARGLFDSDAAPRIAAASFATVGVLLFYALVQRAFQSIGLAFVSALLLLLTPAYATFARTAAHDGIWLVPLTAAWLLGLAAALARPHDRFGGPVIICAMALAGGVYAQPSGALTVLLLGVLSAAALWPTNLRRISRAAVFALAGAAAVAMPLVIWLARYPFTYADTLGMWLLHPAHLRPRGWASAMSNSQTLAMVSKTYWDFFSPSHLFVSNHAPALAGAFVLPVGVLIAIGAHGVLRQHDALGPSRRFARFVILGVAALSSVMTTFTEPPAIQRTLDIVSFGVLLVVAVLIGLGRRDIFGRHDIDVPSRQLARIALLGVVVVPLVAATFQEPRAIQRALVIVPMAILLAASGIHALWQAGPRSRFAAVLIVAAALIQSLAWYAGVTAP